MNRRDFAKSLAALGLVPALPSMVAAPAVAAPAITPYMYGLGAHLARSKGACSAAMLVQNLGLSPDAAAAMQGQLMRNGVIASPGAAGLARAAQPYMSSAPVAGSAAASITSRAKDAVRKTLLTADDPAPGQPEDDDGANRETGVATE